MVNPGKDCVKTYTCDEIGEATVAVLRRVMPAAMPVRPIACHDMLPITTAMSCLPRLAQHSSCLDAARPGCLDAAHPGCLDACNSHLTVTKLAGRQLPLWRTVARECGCSPQRHQQAQGQLSLEPELFGQCIFLQIHVQSGDIAHMRQAAHFSSFLYPALYRHRSIHIWQHIPLCFVVLNCIGFVCTRIHCLLPHVHACPKTQDIGTWVEDTFLRGNTCPEGIDTGGWSACIS